MIWIIILPFLVLAGWLLLSPVEINVDTRVPAASMRWITIGKVMVVYENEDWWLKIQVVFFRKNWPLVKMFDAENKKQEPAKNIKKQKHGYPGLQKTLSLVKTFQVVQWKIAIDNGDVVTNAWIYPLNYFTFFRQHMHVNFMDENYLALRIRTAPWRMIYAWIK